MKEFIFFTEADCYCLNIQVRLAWPFILKISLFNPPVNYCMVYPIVLSIFYMGVFTYLCVGVIWSRDVSHKLASLKPILRGHAHDQLIILSFSCSSDQTSQWLCIWGMEWAYSDLSWSTRYTNVYVVVTLALSSGHYSCNTLVQHCWIP